MLSYLLLLLLPLSLASDGFGVAGGGPSAPSPPVAGGGPAAPNNEQHQFTFGNLPRVCVECCMDIMFVVDRSVAVKGFANDARVPWKRMLALVADFGAAPLNHPKIRVGAMQMGDPEVISQPDLANADQTGSTKTGIRYPLTSGPFPPTIKERDINGVGIGWGINDQFSNNRAWGTAAQVALDHFKNTNPIYVNDKLLCTPANSVRLMIWIVAGGPEPSTNDPCLGSPSIMSKLNEAGVQQHIVGFGDSWAGAAFVGRQCMFSKGADTKGSLIDGGKPITDITNLLKPSQFNLDPCNKCNGYVDVVFVLDESGSLCDKDSSSLLPGICPHRKEFDLQVDFVGQVIAELGKSWSRHRVAIWSFATKMRNWVKISQTGGKSAKTFPNGNKTWAWDKPMTEAEVQNILPKIKAGFAEGYTATALAYKEALGEIEWAPPRADGNEAKKVVIFMTDGGPNPPYYVVDENGDRTTCTGSNASANGNCLHWTKFWDGSTNAAQVGQMNMAVCTDKNDPNPQWIRYRQKGSGFEQYKSALSWAQAAAAIKMTPLLVLVGPRRDKHEKDIKCLVEGTSGGILTPRSFSELFENPAYRSAVINSLCTPARFGQRESGVLAEWTQYEAYQESQLQAKLSQMAMQQGLIPSQTTANVHYGYGMALVIGVGVASFLYGKHSRAEYNYTPLLSDELMDADRV